MNLRLEKPIGRGETRRGVLTCEENGALCFDETADHWLNNPKRKSVALRRFSQYGTRVSRKGEVLTIKHELPLSALTGDDFMKYLSRANELADALSYCQKYAQRRR